MSRPDPLDAIPLGCAMRELPRCPACSAPVIDRPLAGAPATWDAIACSHTPDGCSVRYELHTPTRCDRIRAFYDHPVHAARSRDLVPAVGDWDPPPIRPVSVRRVDGVWTLFDHGDGLQVRAGVFGTPVSMPSKACCCWDAAQGLADALERHYLDLPAPAWAGRGEHPPTRPGRRPCPGGITA